MKSRYDVIVVGARCAGSPTAMLLARRGYRVLMVDRATFPSDTLSTHVVHPMAGAALERWGLLDRLIATGCPPIHTLAFDFGSIILSGTPGTPDTPVTYCPRRIILDKLLVDAAVEAGVELREGFTVERIVSDNGRVIGIEGHTRGGATITEGADIVVGADGWHSSVVDAVRPERYHEKPPLLAAYYSYWSGVPTNGQFQLHIRPRRGFGAVPTHDGLTLVVVGWPQSEFETNRHDVERHFLESLDLAPAFAERVRAGKREAKFAGASIPNYFHKPFGSGWVLVGDAGYIKDSITAQGINDAFHDAERVAIALDHTLSGARSFDESMGEYQRERDQHVLPMFELTCQLATLEPPPPELQQLFGAIAGKQPAMNRFAQMNAGTISPAQFFAPESVQAMMAGAM